MFRLRSKKLLSGVSALAVLATFGAVDPVLAAGTTISGPGSVPAIDTSVDTAAGTRDFVNIDTNANVGVDGSGRSFYNPLTGVGTVAIGGVATTALQIDNSILQGSIVNEAVISSTSADGINIENSIINGGIVNSGLIASTGSGAGIDINTSTFAGGINNSGTISSAFSGDGINIDDTIFSGGITNSGTITAGGSGDGIDLEDGLSFSGGINNSGTIVGGGSSEAIESDADIFQGGITNSGLIQGTGGSGDAIDLDDGPFSGGITNTLTGTIEVTGGSADAIEISNDLFQGGINNSGTILANQASANAIQIDGDTFQGGITNTGTIASDSSSTIFFNGKLFQGGITNNGLIDSSSGTAINISGNTFQGGIHNQANGLIEASDDGVNINGTTFQGGVNNAGLIDSTGSGNALDINGTTFEGGITNTGTLWGGFSADAVTISGNSFAGGIVNSGTITAEPSGDGIDISGSSFSGGINNQVGGFIDGNLNAINITGTTFAGGITNAGQIGGTLSGTAVDGINFSGTSFTGGINNTSTGVIQGSNNGIELSGTSFSGGITNAGLIESTDTENAILISSTTFAGGINNTSTGTISGDTGIFIDSSVTSFDGGITNAGFIEGYDTHGVLISGNTFSGGINNTATGTIVGLTDGIQITSDTNSFSGGLTNAGVIESTGGGNGVEIDANFFAGGVINSGTIKGLNDTGLAITSDTFDGGLTNSGTILGDYPGVVIDVNNWSGGFNNDGGLIAGTGTSADGVRVDANNWTGDFTNSGTINSDIGTITPNGTGVDLFVDNFFGNFDNSGAILGFNRGVFLDGKLFSGNVSNSGWIDGGEGEGLRLAMDLLAGDVTNAAGGLISATRDALKIVGGTTITGDVSNAGSIESTNEDAIDVNGVVEGMLTTSGYVFGERNGIDVDGEIQGGIFVTGGQVIGNTEGGIDLDSANAAHTITQTGGTISDGGEASYAIRMDNSFTDTFFANGGAVQGDIEGGEGNIDDMITQSGTFAWHYGTGSGLDEFDVDGGTAIYGATARGVDGPGVFVSTANSMNVAGWAYLDDNTAIDLNNGYVQTGTGTIEYFLTTNTAVHGTINAASTTLDGNIAAFIDPVSFAAIVIPTTSTLVYDDVLNSTGALVGTFDNTASILTSSIFFQGFATYDIANDVDINLQRIAFNDALDAIGATETQNQESVAAAIETIYTNGGYSGDFQDFLELLFGGGLTGAQFQAILDDLSGSEHAQLQGSVLTLNGILNSFMTERLDGAKLTQGGGSMAALDGRRYAQAAPPPASDAGPPSSYGSHGLTRGKTGVSVWARVFGQWDHNDGDPEAASFDQDSTGGALGIDYAVANNAMIGIAGNFANTDVDFDTAGDTADIDTWQVGLYGSYGFGRFYLDGMANYGSHDLSTVRTILPPVPGAPFTTAAGYDASTWSVAGEVGGIWRLGRVDIQPSARLAWTSSDTDGFSESGTGPGGIFDLIVQGSDADSLASTLAIRGSGVWTMGRTKVVPDIKVGWRHEFSDDRYSFVAAFAEDPTTTFTIVSSGVQEDSAVVSAGLVFGLTTNFEVMVDFNGNYGSDVSQSNASGGVRFTW